jgi:mannose-6-phosphate isomerase-like protein (cupin superfamily)
MITSHTRRRRWKQEVTMSNPVAPFAVLSGEGTPLEIPFGGSVTIKAHTRNTNGSLTVLEFVHPPKAGPALHTHLREDEVWYVLEGEYRVKAGDAMFRLSAGGMAFGPRGTPHGFQNVGDTPGRLLVIATPSGVERWFEQCAELLPDRLDMEALAAITDANWAELVGPPLAVSDPL